MGCLKIFERRAKHHKGRGLFCLSSPPPIEERVNLLIESELITYILWCSKETNKMFFFLFFFELITCQAIWLHTLLYRQHFLKFWRKRCKKLWIYHDEFCNYSKKFCYSSDLLDFFGNSDYRWITGAPLHKQSATVITGHDDRKLRTNEDDLSLGPSL